MKIRKKKSKEQETIDSIAKMAKESVDNLKLMFTVARVDSISNKLKKLADREQTMFKSPMFNTYLIRYVKIWTCLVILSKVIVIYLVGIILTNSPKLPTKDKFWYKMERLMNWCTKERWAMVNDFNDKMIS